MCLCAYDCIQSGVAITVFNGWFVVGSCGVKGCASARGAELLHLLQGGPPAPGVLWGSMDALVSYTRTCIYGRARFCGVMPKECSKPRTHQQEPGHPNASTRPFTTPIAPFPHSRPRSSGFGRPLRASGSPRPPSLLPRPRKAAHPPSPPPVPNQNHPPAGTGARAAWPRAAGASNPAG